VGRKESEADQRQGGRASIKIDLFLIRVEGGRRFHINQVGCPRRERRTAGPEPEEADTPHPKTASPLPFWQAYI
jgi:hypothetical protein